MIKQLVIARYKREYRTRYDVSKARHCYERRSRENKDRASIFTRGSEKNKLNFSVEAEDIHLNIEKMLIERIGEVGGKLHTGRSRNDQVATDMHLYLKEKVEDIIKATKQLQTVLVHQAENNIETIMPGYTHLQRAQPISFAHHIPCLLLDVRARCESL